MVGYSGTPLLKKLGFKPAVPVLLLDAPSEYAAWLGEIPPGMTLTAEWPASGEIPCAHIFVSDRAVLERRLRDLREQLAKDGFVWVSWPKRASKIASDVTEDTIREVALPLGFVDIKVCAVSEVWSGLKLVIRKELRI